MLTKKEILIVHIKSQNSLIVHLRKMIGTPATKRDKQMLMVLNELCGSMPAMESLLWQYLGSSSDEVTALIERGKAERKLYKCKCGHSKSGHGLEGCTDCECSIFIDPDGWQ